MTVPSFTYPPKLTDLNRSTRAFHLFRSKCPCAVLKYSWLPVNVSATLPPLALISASSLRSELGQIPSAERRERLAEHAERNAAGEDRGTGGTGHWLLGEREAAVGIERVGAIAADEGEDERQPGGSESCNPARKLERVRHKRLPLRGCVP